MKKCTIRGCEKIQCAKGLCPMHYRRKNVYKHIPMNKKPYFIYGQGFTIDKDGYKQIKNESGKVVREHRLIMERHIKRKLTPTECVHHKNGIRTDNRLENLEIISFQEHSKLHHVGISKDIKEMALELYKKGIPITQIPKELPIGYSCAYWFIKKNGTLRGRGWRSKTRNSH